MMSEKNQTLKCNAEIILTFAVHGMSFNFSYNEEIVFM